MYSHVRILKYGHTERCRMRDVVALGILVAILAVAGIAVGYTVGNGMNSPAPAVPANCQGYTDKGMMGNGMLGGHGMMGSGGMAGTRDPATQAHMQEMYTYCQQGGITWQEMQAHCEGMMGENPAGNATSPPAGAVVVEMRGSQFQPVPLKVKVGQTVAWVNRNLYAHTVTSDGQAPLDSPLIGPGQSWSYTFTQAGTFAYHCTPHSYQDSSGAYRGMVGLVIVG